MLIEGHVCRGMGGAGRALRRQRPLFARRGLPGVERLVDGTINVDTSPLAVTVRLFDYFFGQVRHKRFPRPRQEDFGFVRLAWLSLNGRTYAAPGYLYLPMSSPHRREPALLEIWARPIEDVAVGAHVRLCVSDHRLALVPLATTLLA